MKKTFNNIILSGGRLMVVSALVSLALSLSSCGEDFLDKTPSGNYTAETFYSSDDLVLAGVEPLYNRAWFDFNRRAIVGMGSYRANDAWNPYVSAEFARFQITSLTEDMSLAWSSLYNVVTMANATLENLQKYCTDDVSEDIKNQAMGECYMMRATAYFYLLRGWGANILFEDNQKLIDNPVQPLNTEEDVLKFIVRDYRKAISLMRETAGSNHPSKYAVKALLAKALLAQAGWNKTTRDATILSEVVSLCDEVINCGQFSLMSDYEDLFKAQNNDNSETILAMRWADPNTGTWGTMNALYSDLAFPEVTDVNVWGGNLIASVDMIDYYNEEPNDTSRIRGTFFTPNRYYSYILQSDGGYTYKHNWMQCKKGVLGTKVDAGGHLAQMASPLNTYIMRLAEVYLIKAEALMSPSNPEASCTDADGLAAINAVRSRAGVSALTSYNLATIIREHRIEFCMEYKNWFDMVTWYRWQPQYMLNFFNNKQHRAFEYREGDVLMNEDGTISYRAFLNSGTDCWYFTDPEGHVYWNDHMAVSESDNSVWNNMDAAHGYKINVDSILRANTNFVPITLSETNIFMPYPEADVLQNHYLNEDPVAYEFSDEE